MQVKREGIGLRTASAGDRVALRGVHLSARLSGMSLRATVEQTFINLEPLPIEAVYTFPLPEGAAVCGFEVITAERVLTGNVEELNQGIEQYEQAISEGHGAFLMEQERPDIFTVRVGNLRPRQAATIRLSYVCALERVDKSIRVAFPTTIAPRYTTATGTDPIEAAIDGDALNPPHVLSVPYGLSIEVDVALGRQLRHVSSPSHAITIANGEEATCRITFAGGVAEMDRDVVLLLDLAREHQPSVQTSRGKEGETYLAVTFVPEFDEDSLTEPAPTETIFVLDCSGSMMGDSITQAIAALELCLRSMSVGDTFNICRFGSTWELLSSEPLVYSQQTLERALKYVGEVRDLGGTELHPPLEAILSQKPRAGTVRQVILLTDGQVSNEPAVVELSRKYRKNNRIFSFGIGSACSAYLVKGIARATGGASEFITAGERIDDKVLRTFGRLTSPPVTDISIDWDGCDVQTLAELPPVFDGDVMAVFGRAPSRVPRSVRLSCETPAGPKTWSVTVPPPLEDSGVIATMWARRTIQSMEEVNGIQSTRSRLPDASREREMLIQLSKQFGLLCSLTTFVAVEHRSPAERNSGEPAVRRVPVKLAAGWGGVDVAPAAMACAPARSVSAVGGGMMPPAPMQTAPAGRRSRGSLLGNIFGKAGRAPAAPPPVSLPASGMSQAEYAKMQGPAAEAKRKKHDSSKLSKSSAMDRDAGGVFGAEDEALPPGDGTGLLDLTRESDDSNAPSFEDELKSLLALQTADGWFGTASSTDELIVRAGADAAQWTKTIESALPAQLKDAQARAKVVRTAISLLLLQSRLSSLQSLWKRAHAKAIRYLATALSISNAEVEAWLADLRNKLGV